MRYRWKALCIGVVVPMLGALAPGHAQATPTLPNAFVYAAAGSQVVYGPGTASENDPGTAFFGARGASGTATLTPDPGATGSAYATSGNNISGGGAITYYFGVFGPSADFFPGETIPVSIAADGQASGSGLHEADAYILFEGANDPNISVHYPMTVIASAYNCFDQGHTAGNINCNQPSVTSFPVAETIRVTPNVVDTLYVAAGVIAEGTPAFADNNGSASVDPVLTLAPGYGPDVSLVISLGVGNGPPSGGSIGGSGGGPVVGVPEPASLALFLPGLLGLAFLRSRPG